jgi:hypothetical protein
MPFPDYGDVPAWLAAGAAVFALSGAGLLYRKQSGQLDEQRKVSEKQTAVLELQVTELRESLGERLRAQAAQIFIEVDRIPPAAEAIGETPPATDDTAKTPPTAEGTAPGRDEPGPLPWRLRAKVHNTSKQPIYDLYVIWQIGTVRMGRPDPLARLMPGRDASFDRTRPPVAAGLLSDPSAFLAFRDAAGVRWAVREDGTLTETSRPSQDA